jgi:lactate racemase
LTLEQQDQEVGLRTSAWYEESVLPLRFPQGWEITTLWPSTPPPLTDDEIRKALEDPFGQPSLRHLAAGKRRPVVLVDDLTRPTPADRIMPFILEQFEAAGVRSEDVTIVMAAGAHGPPPRASIAKKVGPRAAARCALVGHDHRRDAVKVGRTTFGSPILVNRVVAAADLLIGVGGIYPQHSTGFGGGSKLALGVLGTRSIIRLHYGHSGMGGSYRTDNPFRAELDEISDILGLHSMISVHVDANREVVRVRSGDHRRYYDEEVRFAKMTFSAPGPGDAAVVISNAYPADVSLTFGRSKGVMPLLRAAPGSSRVLISACPEGVGRHDLFPFVDKSRWHRQRHVARVVRARPGEAPGRIARRLSRNLQGRAARARFGRRSDRDAGAGTKSALTEKSSLWLYAPTAAQLPASVPGMTRITTWAGVMEAIDRQHGYPQLPLRVVVYPCAPLQVLETSGSGPEPTGAE